MHWKSVDGYVQYGILFLHSKSNISMNFYLFIWCWAMCKDQIFAVFKSQLICQNQHKSTTKFLPKPWFYATTRTYTDFFFASLLNIYQQRKFTLKIESSLIFRFSLFEAKIGFLSNKLIFCVALLAFFVLSKEKKVIWKTTLKFYFVEIVYRIWSEMQQKYQQKCKIE